MNYPTLPISLPFVEALKGLDLKRKIEPGRLEDVVSGLINQTLSAMGSDPEKPASPPNTQSRVHYDPEHHFLVIEKKTFEGERLISIKTASLQPAGVIYTARDCPVGQVVVTCNTGAALAGAFTLVAGLRWASCIKQ